MLEASREILRQTKAQDDNASDGSESQQSAGPGGAR